MNERIKELYEQAHDIEKNTLYFICPTMGPDVPLQVSREEEIRLFNHEKFALLIIRDCMDVVCDINQEYDGGSTVVNAAELIKEYFEVE